MPQFDPATFGSQLFWLVLCFVTLNVAMLGWLLPRLRKTIEKRTDTIKKNQRKTQELLDKITATNHEADHQLHLARTQARDYVNRGLQDLEKEHKMALKACEVSLQEKTTQYEISLDVQIEKARHDLKGSAVEFADELAKKFFPQTEHCPEKKPSP